MLRIVWVLLILLCIGLLAWTAAKHYPILRKKQELSPDLFLWIKKILYCSSFLFTLAFILAIIDCRNNNYHWVFSPFRIFLFLNALFLLLFVQRLSFSSPNPLKKHSRRHLYNALKLNEMLEQDKLLRTVNHMASILLVSEMGRFNESMLKCFQMLSEAVAVDRTYIWENYMKDNKLYCTQLFEWSGGAEPQQGNDLTVDVPFPQDWYEPLSNNRCVNGIVSTFPDYARKHLQAQGIISILVVPVFLEDKFWGFVGFDDCHKERIFSDVEEGILRSASLLIATSMLRNEITKNLVLAREEALSSTKAKSEFLSNMSHEIRTPINAITGMAAIARRTTDITKIHDCLDKIETASHQLIGLINDILDMSKIEAGKMRLSSTTFSLPQLLENVKNMITVKTNEKNQNFSCTVSEDLPEMVLGDDVRLSQILINLLSNAVKFTPENGTIHMEVSLLSRKKNDYTLQACVCDDGIGISAQQQQHLFRPFEQADRNIVRQYGGTGLGLTISKSIAKLMRGDITLKSKPGEGSCFTARFTLKQSDVKKTAETEIKDISAIDFSNYTALLAEDIPINREIVIELLRPTRMTIDYVEDGKAAVQKISDHPEKYDIVFMDVQMPQMDGYQATRAIRNLDHETAKNIPIIAMTANAYKEDVQKALESGMNEHVSKPINLTELLHTIKKLLP